MAPLSRAPVRDADVDRHVALAATTYPGEPPSDPVHFRWKHLANPGGASIVVALGDPSAAPIGHVFLQQRAWVTGNGDARRAGLVTDLVLDPSARHARSFIALMSDARATDDLDVVVHTANEVSEPLYRRLLRYPVAFELRAYGCPTGRMGDALGRSARERLLGGAASIAGVVTGRAARLLAPLVGYVAGVSVRTTEPIPDQIDDALRGFRAVAGPHLARDRAFIEWRFRDAP